MQIKDIRVAHIEQPLGYDLSIPVLTYRVADAAGQYAENIKVTVYQRENAIYSHEGKDIKPTGFKLPITLCPRTAYRVRVEVTDNTGDKGVGESVFEIGKMDEPWAAKWITAPFDKDIHPVLKKSFNIAELPQTARIYITGLGLYELFINGSRVGDERLTPFYNDYDNFIQVQTYDIGKLLKAGSNEISVLLGNGWYKGRLGWGDGCTALFGDEMKLLCELHLDDKIITTDESWTCAPSFIKFSGIYDGEVQDFTADAGAQVNAVQAAAPQAMLMDRISPPVRVTQELKPVSLLTTPKGEKVLDFGQVLTGFLRFTCREEEGTKIYLQFGELLQHDCFYRDNLRSAKAEFTCIADGKVREIYPRFTFYGFRFVKVEGIENIDLHDFTACVVHSDLNITGHIETSDARVNRLFKNAQWSQRGNFLDTPTDCPQRDERMGWTGDAQVFAPTACYNMYTPAFYRKYLYDMLLEQRKEDGCVADVVPDLLKRVNARVEHMAANKGSCAWGDAATVIPWTVYRFYGDRELLASQYENMTLWADWINSQDDGDFLWRKGTHYADWLALDNPVPDSCYGGTDQYYVASVYYYYSTDLCRKAARVLGYAEDESKYAKRAEAIKEAIRKEYFTATGRIAEPTQTAMVLALWFDLVPDAFRSRLINDLRNKLISRDVHLDTGFVGTYFLLPTLSKCGLDDMAVQLLFNEDFPSWLYEVNMGATTIWERWNSVLPDGLVSGTGMNSMNHYAYGSVVEWIYRNLCGLKGNDEYPGFVASSFEPHTTDRLKYVSCEYMSAMGLYRCGWKREEGQTVYTLEVPFGCRTEFIPEDESCPYTLNGERCIGRKILEKGSYTITVTK